MPNDSLGWLTSSTCPMLSFLIQHPGVMCCSLWSTQETPVSVHLNEVLPDAPPGCPEWLLSRGASLMLILSPAKAFWDEAGGLARTHKARLWCPALAGTQELNQGLEADQGTPFSLFYGIQERNALLSCEARWKHNTSSLGCHGVRPTHQPPSVEFIQVSVCQWDRTVTVI